MAICALAPNKNKPKVVNDIQELRGDIKIKRVSDIPAPQAASVATNIAPISKATVKMLQAEHDTKGKVYEIHCGK